MKPSQVERLIPTLYKLRRSFFLKGPVGVGKSSIVQQACDKLGIEMRDVRMSQMDPTDIKGFPCPDMKKGVMHWLTPDFLPTDPKSKGILFLDELTSAPTAVQASAYQLMLDRKIGNYTLPEGWSVAAAGNRDIDRSIVNKMPAALANRMTHMDIEADLQDFCLWGMANGVTSTTIAFARFRELLLHNFEPNSSEAAFPTPRTWVAADEILQQGLPTEDSLALLQGTVGRAAAGEYVAFASMMNQLPSREEIAMDPETAPLPEEASAQLATATMLSMAANDLSLWKTYLKYMERMTQEFQAVFVRDMLLKTDTVPIKTTAEWTKWAVKNADVLL